MNEKYRGNPGKLKLTAKVLYVKNSDALPQKKYTADFLTKKQVKNNGEIPQYYIERDHEACT